MALESSFGDVKSKIKASQSFNQITNDIKSLKDNASNSTEDAKQNLVTQLDKLKEAVTGSTNTKKYAKQIKSQFEELLSLTQQTKGSGLDTSKFLMKKVVKSWRKVSPEIKKILVEEILKVLGCSQEQTYNINNPIYVKVSSIDLFDLLKEDPNSNRGKVLYESIAPSYGVRPFSMNRDLFYRISTPGFPTYLQDAGSFYKGGSGQNLFNYQYSQTDTFGQSGDFIKIDLQPRNTIVGGFVNPGTNRVGDFLTDYYSTIKIMDTTNIFSNLMNGLTGCIDIQANVSNSKISSDEKVGLIIQRILGLCFGDKQEIDVQGNAKVSEEDDIDDSFFELSEIDLRLIDEKINDRRNGVAEFQDCGNLKLPVDYGSIYQNLLEIEGNGSSTPPSQEKQDEIITNLTTTVSNNPIWSLLIPTGLNIKVKLNLNFITQLPKALIFGILTPKVLLPLMLMLKALGQTIGDSIEDVSTFMKNFRKFFLNLVSKIGALFVRELFAEIKKDIAKLIRSIGTEVAKNAAAKQYAIIFALVELAMIIAKAINDWRQCKSIIDELMALLSLSSAYLGGGIPLPLLAFSSMLPGFSSDRAFINSIEEMQKLGIPTGPMPDGSPNLGMAAMFSGMKGQDSEEASNGKLEIFVPSAAITPAGTIPGKAYGKKI